MPKGNRPVHAALALPDKMAEIERLIRSNGGECDRDRDAGTSTGTLMGHVIMRALDKGNGSWLVMYYNSPNCYWPKPGEGADNA